MAKIEYTINLDKNNVDGRFVSDIFDQGLKEIEDNSERKLLSWSDAPYLAGATLLFPPAAGLAGVVPLVRMATVDVEGSTDAYDKLKTFKFELEIPNAVLATKDPEIINHEANKAMINYLRKLKEDENGYFSSRPDRGAYEKFYDNLIDAIKKERTVMVSSDPRVNPGVKMTQDQKDGGPEKTDNTDPNKTVQNPGGAEKTKTKSPDFIGDGQSPTSKEMFNGVADWGSWIFKKVGSTLGNYDESELESNGEYSVADMAGKGLNWITNSWNGLAQQGEIGRIGAKAGVGFLTWFVSDTVLGFIPGIKDSWLKTIATWGLTFYMAASSYSERPNKPGASKSTDARQETRSPDGGLLQQGDRGATPDDKTAQVIAFQNADGGLPTILDQNNNIKGWNKIVMGEGSQDGAIQLNITNDAGGTNVVNLNAKRADVIREMAEQKVSFSKEKKLVIGGGADAIVVGSAQDLGLEP